MIEPSGKMLIGGAEVYGSKGCLRALNPATGTELEPAFGLADTADVQRSCALARDAFDAYRETGLEARAVFLETIAEQIISLGDVLIERAVQETGLPRVRIEGERRRTTEQLRMFARLVRKGDWLQACINPSLPDRKPLPRADVRRRHVAVGPVVVFGASNFPLAFSVAGGDTASALAAGCPVIVKAHTAHPGVSELVGRAVQRAATACGMPDGVFSLLFSAGNEIGTALVQDSRIKAVGFTGSRSGGIALTKVAAARPEPIPVYAEMSSINPVYLLPGALKARTEAIATGFVASLTAGSGQFCTNPGLLLGLDSSELDGFVVAAQASLQQYMATPMLSPGIHQAYEQAVERLSKHHEVTVLARGRPGVGGCEGQAALFATGAEAFLGDAVLQEEMFGAASLLVRCRDRQQLLAVAEALEGQLTSTLQMDAVDLETARALLPVLERKAGRILVNDWPTGVEVCDAMVHGGPFPATSDPRSTSVGTSAIERFLRPVCYQNFPDPLLPPSLAEANPLGVRRRGDGRSGVPT